MASGKDREVIVKASNGWTRSPFQEAYSAPEAALAADCETSFLICQEAVTGPN
jgi:hypothetical protein